MKLEEQIKNFMNSKSITSYQISKDLEIDESQLSRFFNGKSSISLKRIEQIIDYIGGELKIIDKN